MEISLRYDTILELSRKRGNGMVRFRVFVCVCPLIGLGGILVLVAQDRV